jgi:serine protease Do
MNPSIARIAFSVILTALILFALLSAGPSSAEFSAADVYREAAPAVVVIFGFDAKGRGRSGTGSVISADGLILTNDHVIRDASTGRPYATLQVFLKPERVTGDDRTDLSIPHGARLIARDRKLDLALLRLTRPPADLRPLRFGDSEEVVVGEPVAAIGHPSGGGLWTLTTGTISSRRRDGARDVFQTDAAINPGNSGGPLLDATSHLIGINTFVRRMNDEGMPLEGLNYSLRGSLILDWLAGQGVQLAAVRRKEVASGSDDSPEAVAVPEPLVEEPNPQRVGPLPLESPTQAAPPSASVMPVEPPSAVEAPPVVQAPQDFAGEWGEAMYGVPNRAFRLDDAMKAAYLATQQNAREAFGALECEPSSQ